MKVQPATYFTRIFTPVRSSNSVAFGKKRPNDVKGSQRENLKSHPELASVSPLDGEDFLPQSFKKSARADKWGKKTRSRVIGKKKVGYQQKNKTAPNTTKKPLRSACTIMNSSIGQEISVIRGRYRIEKLVIPK
ncbi:MAG: hypothetical protein AAGI66_01450 [Cyanobacteria bacterium P01_H01_bin.74]